MPAQEFSTLLLLHLRSTEVLASYCWSNFILCFKLRPKHHCLWHVAMDAGRNKLNPKLFHVWDDEKWLGCVKKIKKIAKRCHGATVQKRAMERYILALSHYLHTYGDSWCKWHISRKKTAHNCGGMLQSNLKSTCLSVCIIILSNIVIDLCIREYHQCEHYMSPSVKRSAAVGCTQPRCELAKRAAEWPGDKAAQLMAELGKCS